MKTCFFSDYDKQWRYPFCLLVLLFCLMNGQFTFAQSGIVSQAKKKQPTLIVIPSDNLLYDLGCLDSIDNQGLIVYLPRYKKAFVKNKDLLFMIGAIEDRFSEMGFPIEGLERAMQSRGFKDHLENASGVEEGPRSILLKSARADIILDLNYGIKSGGLGNSISLGITARDAYTNLSIASVYYGGRSIAPSNIKMILDLAEKQVNNLQLKVMEYYERLRRDGRNVTLDVLLDQSVSFTMDDYCPNQSSPVGEFIEDWVMDNSVNQDYALDLYEEDRLEFTSIRIPFFDERGRPIDVRYWLRDLVKELKNTCGVHAKNRTKGLGGGGIILSNQ